MLYDLYRTNTTGGDEEVAARRTQEAHGEKYLWTVNDPQEARAAAAEDHAESGGTGGIITRSATLQALPEVLK